MWIAIQRNLMELTLLVIVVFGLAVLFGAMAFFLELMEPLEWWVSCGAVTGVIALAMPVAVLTQSFNEYYARQEVNKEKLKSQELYFKLPSVRGSDPSGDD
nr:hypothetical protein BaRGS_013844 [Batillaria attramentaria]